MRNILLVTQDDEGQEARLQAALDVAKALDGHLTCLDLVALTPVYSDAFAGPAMVLLIDQERERETRNCEMLERRLAREDAVWELRQVTGDLVPEISEAARLADLIVLSSRQGGDFDDDRRPGAGDVVIDSGRAVLAVPDTSRGIDLRGTVLIAWDGSRQSIEALRAAVPLLQLSEDPVLFQVESNTASTTAEEAAQYLSRHGIHPRIEKCKADGTIAETILSGARELGAAYIVMGAFGHSRLQEALFGGVTRSLLRQCDLPLLMAH